MSGVSEESVFVISGDTLGRGNDDLGRKLMGKLVLQLSTQVPKPHALVFYNAGVKLVAEGSTCLEGLRTLDEEGAELLVCGTCVDFYQLTGRIAVGRVTDMREIFSSINRAPKVVTV